MSKKIYDAAVKVGEYEANGETKGRYVNVGAVLKTDDGGPYLVLDRTFNPAGVPNPENRPNVIVSFFTPKDKSATAKPASGKPADDYEQSPDIPF